MKYQSFQEFCASIAERNPGQSEYMQAVAEVMESLWPFITEHPNMPSMAFWIGLLNRNEQLFSGWPG